jgi:hypothetical protein
LECYDCGGSLFEPNCCTAYCEGGDRCYGDRCHKYHEPEPEPEPEPEAKTKVVDAPKKADAVKKDDAPKKAESDKTAEVNKEEVKAKPSSASASADDASITPATTGMAAPAAAKPVLKVFTGAWADAEDDEED